MKNFLKAVAVGVAVTFAVSAAPVKAHADHNDGWNTAAAVIAGVAAVGVIAAIASQHDAVSADVHVSHYGPPLPPPPPRCEPPRRWIPGHYECNRERVCIPGYWETVTEPAQYSWVRYGCRWEYVVVKPACARRVWVPERFEWQETKIWVPGRYEFGNGNAYGRYKDDKPARYFGKGKQEWYERNDRYDRADRHDNRD
jgi:hypothetical protein